MRRFCYAAAAIHQPVLLQPLLRHLIAPRFAANVSPEASLTLLDATLGDGGHARAFLSTYPQLSVIGVDRDPASITFATSHWGAPFIALQRLRLHCQRFSSIGSLAPAGSLQAILMDLGVSSRQLDDPSRGFSFRFDGPLDMRMRQGTSLQHRVLQAPLHGEDSRGAGKLWEADESDDGSASDLLQSLSIDQLEEILRIYGEEAFSKRIARAIIAYRERNGRISTTRELVGVIEGAVPAAYRFGRISPCTRTFQALRIFVNDELEEIRKGMRAAKELLCPGGRLAIISFHSLEDRLVKEFFREEPSLSPLMKKPISAEDDEVQRNPRSRSAKLRIAEKI